VGRLPAILALKNGRIGSAKLVVESEQLRICGFKECCGIFRLAWACFGLS
jgi:hypothetical protein